jgi:hypothetical protein
MLGITLLQIVCAVIAVYFPPKAAMVVGGDYRELTVEAATGEAFTWILNSLGLLCRLGGRTARLFCCDPLRTKIPAMT